jgi:hypothetical protein
MIAEMRLSIAGLLADPDDEALINHYAENLEHYYAEPAISFRHVYFREPPEDPAQVLSRLRDGAEIAGDFFPQGSEFRAYGRSMLRGLFGQAFLARWTSCRWANGTVLSSRRGAGTSCGPTSACPPTGCRSSRCAARSSRTTCAP